MSKVKFDRLPRLGILVALAVLVFPGPDNTEGQISSAGIQPIWATRVTPLVKEPPEWSQVEHHETVALAFSPDDQRLAVTLAHNEFIAATKTHFNTHLLVIDVQSPKTNVHQFDLSETCGADLAWNERGNALLVCGTFLRLADDTRCDTLVGSSRARRSSAFKVFWLDSEHIVRSNTGEILDMACKQAGRWQLEPGWRIRAVAPSKGLVLQWHIKGRPANIACEYSLVDLASHQTLNGWADRKLPCSTDMMLVVGAEAVCSSLEGGDMTKGKLHCWAINGGKEIPIPKKARGHVLNSAAITSARVVAEKWEYERSPWWISLLFWWVPVPGPSALPQRRVVFDLRSEDWISSWKSRLQDSSSPRVLGHAYRCALATNGEFLAESGDGGLELFRIAP
jgi:hypothetical protein